MALFSQPNRFFHFQKYYLHGYFKTAPSNFFNFQKSYLHGSFQPVARFFSFSKILTPWPFSASPSNFFISKNPTSMALFHQPTRIFSFPQMSPSWLTRAITLPIFTFNITSHLRSLEPSLYQFSVSKNSPFLDHLLHGKPANNVWYSKKHPIK